MFPATHICPPRQLSKATLFLSLAALLAGCGHPGEDLLNTPEVQQKLAEKARRDEEERESLRLKRAEIERGSSAFSGLADDVRQAEEAAAKKRADAKEPAAREPAAKEPRKDPNGPGDSEPATPPALKTENVKVEGGAPEAKSKTDESPPAVAAGKKGTTDDPTPTIAVGSAEAWQRLRAGLDAAIVKKLLGEPSGTGQDQALDYWRYGTGSQGGRVAFLRMGPTGKDLRLIQWQSPIR